MQRMSTSSTRASRSSRPSRPSKKNRATVDEVPVVAPASPTSPRSPTSPTSPTTTTTTTTTAAAAAAMASSSPTSGSFLEQTASVLTSIGSYMRMPALASAGVAAVFTSLLYFKQKSLIYPSNAPANSRTDIPSPADYGVTDFEELFIPTDDGETLAAFYIRGPPPANAPPAPPSTTASDPDGIDGAPPLLMQRRAAAAAAAAAARRAARVTVIMFHGNAGNIGHRLPIALMLRHQLGCNVFLLEYRGYGRSTGEPSEGGLVTDAQTALDYLRARAETRAHRFVVYGQSLGGAVAVRLVADNQARGDVAALVLENTFLSMRKLIPQILPPTRYVTLLCNQVWPSDAVIPTITKVPILFLSGQRDEIVPPAHMRKLYELSAAPNKIWKELPHGDHNASFCEKGYFEAIADFVASATDEGPPEKML